MSDPIASYVSTTLQYYKNGVLQFEEFNNGSSTVSLVAADVVKFKQVSYPGFVWPKDAGGEWDASATLLITKDGDPIFNETATEQVFELHGDNYEFTALEDGVYVVTASSQSTSTRYTVFNLFVENETATGDEFIRITDNVDGEDVHYQEAITGSSGGYRINELLTSTLYTVAVTNSNAAAVDVRIEGAGGYDQTFTVLTTATGSKTDVPKGNLTITITIP